MTENFKYLKDAISVDLCNFLMEDFGIGMTEALDVLYESETFEKLSNPTTGLYFRGSRYVYSFLLNELKKGIFF